MLTGNDLAAAMMELTQARARVAELEAKVYSPEERRRPVVHTFRVEALERELATACTRAGVMDLALRKISAIRDSLVGYQGFNFSEHAYPLVAALDEAGYEGAGYEIARANLGTLIDQTKAAEARVGELEAQVRTLTQANESVCELCQDKCKHREVLDG